MLNYRITFESGSTMYYPGTQFNGFVSLNNKHNVRARKIDLKIIGRAQTRWTSGSHNNQSSYGCEIYYFYEYTILWQCLDGSNKLPPGEYKFPFTVKIPNNIPPSFNGHLGNVRYFVATNIDVPLDFDIDRILDFIVLGSVDLNADQRLSLQAYTNAIQNISSSWCCSSKSYPIMLKVTLPKTGYISGETISVSINIVNKTSLRITSIEVRIIKEYLFLGNFNYHPPLPNLESKRSAWEETEFYKRFRFPVNDTTSVCTFTVPMLEPSFLECPIMKISYCIFVKAHTNGVFSSGPKVRIPIVIRTVPIVQEGNAISPVPPTSSNVGKDDFDLNVVDSVLKSDKQY